MINSVVPMIGSAIGTKIAVDTALKVSKMYKIPKSTRKRKY